MSIGSQSKAQELLDTSRSTSERLDLNPTGSGDQEDNYFS